MSFRKEFPALNSFTYFNTAYVGLMSQPLMDFRANCEKEYLYKGDQYKIDAYDRLDKTHETIARFIGSKKEQTFFVPNFSVGIRFVLDTLKKGSKVLYIKEDYHSLVDALEERNFNLFSLSIEERLEEKIEALLAEHHCDALVVSMVQFTSGLKVDFNFLASLHEKYPEMLIIGDATQYIGTDFFSFSDSPFDAVVSSGYKWLLAGFGNGFVALSDRFMERTQPKSHTFYQKVFAGHFNILGADSLIFALDYLTQNNFKDLVEKNKMLSNTLREELTKIDWIPEYIDRADQSSIVSVACQEQLLKRLEDQNIRAAYRGNYLRFSPHFYNSTEEIDHLTSVLKGLKKTA